MRKYILSLPFENDQFRCTVQVQRSDNPVADQGLMQKVTDLERTVEELQQRIMSGAGIQASY